MENRDLSRFIRRHTVTLTYIAVILTALLLVRLYEVFWRG